MSSSRLLALSAIVAITSAACGGDGFALSAETGGAGGAPAGSGGASGGASPGTGGSDIGTGGGDVVDASGPTDDGGCTGLVYGFVGQGNPDIAFAPGTTAAWPTGTALPPAISSAGLDEAPLPMPDPADITFLYDTEVNNRRMIYMALSSNGTWSSGR